VNHSWRPALPQEPAALSPTASQRSAWIGVDFCGPFTPQCLHRFLSDWDEITRQATKKLPALLHRTKYFNGRAHKRRVNMLMDVAE
jgi:hypothetical protein